MNAREYAAFRYDTVEVGNRHFKVIVKPIDNLHDRLKFDLGIKKNLLLQLERGS